MQTSKIYIIAIFASFTNYNFFDNGDLPFDIGHYNGDPTIAGHILLWGTY